jgi:catechol 2,3-dioxygenase-like lactoylglutathione lyase family enzyme
MQRVTGIGGIFFKSDDPEKLYAWYEKHLGIKRNPGGPVVFHWREGQDGDRPGTTVWSLFPRNTSYFDPSRANFMLNYRVSDLDALLDVLRAEDVEIDPKREDSEFGRFAWIMDPEGNRIELWEPPKGM